MNALLSPRTLRPETQLLVIEAGASPLLGLARRALGPIETWTLPQHAGKLAALANARAPQQRTLQSAAVLLSPTVARSEQELLQRARIARLLLAPLLRSGSGELLFVTSAGAERELRQELLALIDIFLTELGDDRLLISALFLDAPRPKRRIRPADFEAGMGLPL